MMRLGALLCAGALAWAADPVRIVIVTHSSQLLLEARARFEAQYGVGLLDLRVTPGTEEAALAGARVIHFYYGGQDVFRRQAPAVRSASRQGAKVVAYPEENARRLLNVPLDEALSREAGEYWANGGVENLTALLALLYRAGDGQQAIEIPKARAAPAMGIYHPRSPAPFLNTEDFLAWYRADSKLPSAAPLAGVLVYSANYKNRDLAHVDALIGELEKQGIGAACVYGWPVSGLEPLLASGGKSRFDILLAANLNFLQSADAPFLERLDVPVLNLMSTRTSEAEWASSPVGVTAERVAMMAAAPERAGATDPVLIASTETDKTTGAQWTAPIAERITMAAARARRWLALRTKPSSEKRVVVIYFNSPPRKGNIGASYLNVVPSLLAVLRRMQADGYNTGPLPDERQLLAMLERGSSEPLSGEIYRSWFAELPKDFQRYVAQRWGAPDGRRPYAIAGVRFGNVFVGPQPPRSTIEIDTKAQHNILVPPPHAYVAAYLWYRKVFQADAIAHIGRHGTLEFLPGKNMGQAGWDSSEVLLGDVPSPYVYIIDGGGESTIARRRGAGVMVSHLTPLAVPAGEQKENDALRQALRGYAETRETSPALAGQYRETILAEVRKLKLDRQLGLKPDRWEDTLRQVEEFLEAAEHSAIPAGVHTLGKLPEERLQREALGEFLKTFFAPGELRGQLENWASELMTGRMPAHTGGMEEAALEGGRQWLEALRASPARELEAWSRVLGGHYLPSGTTGDPLRTPSSIPSGRNLHDFDPALIPTRAAWELGKRMGDELLAQFRREKGRTPEKISMVLWYGETIRHQGAMECEAFYLMGVEPKWNSRGIVDGFRVIPDAELGRPRVDVVVTLGGIYRDGLADKVLLLERAARIVEALGDNAISRNTRHAQAELMRQGAQPEQAARLARARAFAAAPGDYGAGISKQAKRSRSAADTQAMTDTYMAYMGHAYSSEVWGDAAPEALAAQLEGNEAIVHSRSTAVYGVLDNDDFFEFAGGLNLASKAANGGVAPEFLVNDVRTRGQERVTSLRTFLAQELNARYWNPKWIEEMKKGGYAGAREMQDNLENLAGWQATSPEQVDETVWRKTYEVYVADSKGLGLKKFFEAVNPRARQMMLGRLLDVDRQGIHRFSGTERALMTRPAGGGGPAGAPQVKGFRMREKTMQLSSGEAAPRMVTWYPVLLAMLVLAGFLAEALRRRQSA